MVNEIGLLKYIAFTKLKNLVYYYAAEKTSYLN